MSKFALMAALIVGCGGDPPSCQQELDHYYAAGCSYYDSRTTPPTAISQSQMIVFCQTAATQIPANCRGALDGWLECDAAVNDRATTNADCDCSGEYMALLECR